MSLLPRIKQGGTWLLNRLLINIGPGNTSASIGFGSANIEQWRWEIRENAKDAQGYQLVLRDHKNGVDRLTISGFGSFLPYYRDQTIGYGYSRFRDFWGQNLYLYRLAAGTFVQRVCGIAIGTEAANPDLDADIIPEPKWVVASLRPDQLKANDLVLVRDETRDVDILAIDQDTGTVKYGAGLRPKFLNDTDAQNETIYYSLTAAKIVYKDAGGVVHPFY